MQSAAKDASNTANRQKTVLRNAIKDHWQKHKLPIGSFLRSDGLEIKFEANETSAIDPERVLEQFEEGEITRDQLLRMLSINKTEAKNVLGGDQVADFTITTVGNKADVRIESLPVENIDDEFVMENERIRKKVKRRIFGGKKSGDRASAPKRKRRIKARVSK